MNNEIYGLIKSFLNELKKTYNKKERIILLNKYKDNNMTKVFKEFNLYLTGYIHFLQDECNKVENDFKESIKINNDFPLSWNGLGYLYYYQKRYEEAEDCYKKAIEIDNEYVYPWNNLGNLYQNQERYEEAENCYRKAIKTDVDFAYPWNGLGSLYQNQERYEEAEDCYRKAIKTDVNFAYPWNGLGNLYKNQERYEEAEDCYKKAIKIDADFAYPWNNLGNLYKNQERYEEAEDCYKKAIEIDIDDANPWNNLGNLYKNQERYEEAEDYYRKAIKTDADFAYPWNGLGNLYKNQERYEEAEDCYKKAIKTNADFAYPWNGLGNLYKNQERYEEAEDCYRKAMKIDANNANSYFNLGLLYDKRDKRENAVEFYKKSYELNETNRKYSYYLAKTYYNINSYNKSKKLVEKLINKNETDYWSKQGEQLFKKIENAEKAGKEEKYDKIIEHSKSILRKSNDKKKEFDRFLNECSKNDKIELEILRRWNSYTPIVADNYHESKGGGYFISFKGVGIVIDPGFNFIENFKGKGHFFDEIDKVFISHSHNDHTADLESILTLLYRFNKNKYKKFEEENYDKIKKEIQMELSEKELRKRFNNSNMAKKIDIYMSLGTFKKYSGMFELFKNVNYKIHILESGTEITDIDFENLKVKVLNAKHHDIISDNSSVGLAFKIDKHFVIFTGDSGIDDKTVGEYEKLMNDFIKPHKDSKIILLAHIGGFEEYEEEYDKNSYSNFYKNHLGRLGIAKLTEIIEPDYCLISEFGEEFKGLRIEVAEIFSQVFKHTKFISCDIGLRLIFTNGIINTHGIVGVSEKNPFLKRDVFELDKIKTKLLEVDYSLHYYDSSLSMTNLEIGLALINEYRDIRKI